MHYLITQSADGCQLVDFSDTVIDLAVELRKIRAKNPQTVPAVYDQDVIEKTFLCDSFGIPTQKDGYLIRLDDI